MDAQADPRETPAAGWDPVASQPRPQRARRKDPIRLPRDMSPLHVYQTFKRRADSDGRYTYELGQVNSFTIRRSPLVGAQFYTELSHEGFLLRFRGVIPDQRLGLLFLGLIFVSFGFFLLVAVPVFISAGIFAREVAAEADRWPELRQGYPKAAYPVPVAS